jgi:hypothetical protein
VRASGNSVVELQAVIEKSVVLGLATNTASTSNSLAELMTTYASTLATQVRIKVCACAQQAFSSAASTVSKQAPSAQHQQQRLAQHSTQWLRSWYCTHMQLAGHSSVSCRRRMDQTVLVQCLMMLGCGRGCSEPWL